MMDRPVFTTADYDFELFFDGSWKAWQEGKVMAEGAFSRRELTDLAETAIRVEQSKVGLYDNDRIGEQ
jgi:hypothetical protein